jgi:hypothetical protein
VDELARDVNSFDALLDVHGAGHVVFLPVGAVVIQVVPYGNLERMAWTDFGEPVGDRAPPSDHHLVPLPARHRRAGKRGERCAGELRLPMSIVSCFRALLVC